MTTKVTVKVNGEYNRSVTLDGAGTVNIGPNSEHTFDIPDGLSSMSFSPEEQPAAKQDEGDAAGGADSGDETKAE